MRSVFFGIFSLLASVSAQVIVDNGVCYHIDNGVRVIEDCPPGILLPPSSTDDNPTGHEANSTTTSTSHTSTQTSDSNTISSNALSKFGGVAFGSMVIGMMFLV